MTDLPRFGSPRQALAYLHAHHRGPKAARPRYHDAPPDTGRSHWDGPAIGAMLYGPRDLAEVLRLRALGRKAEVGCGVVPGSDLDNEIREWATSAYVDPPPAILAVERRLRAIMRAHGVLRERRKPVVLPSVHRFRDPDGQVWASLLRVPAENPCEVVGNLPMVP